MAVQPLRRVPGPVDRVVAICGPRFRDSISTRAGHRSTWPVAMGRAGRTSVARPSAAKTGAILRFTPSRQRGHCQIVLAIWTGEVAATVRVSGACKRLRWFLQMWRCVRCCGSFLLDSPRPMGDRGSCSRLLALCSRCNGCVQLEVGAAPPGARTMPILSPRC